jgi:hypothetical protein
MKVSRAKAARGEPPPEPCNHCGGGHWRFQCSATKETREAFAETTKPYGQTSVKPRATLSDAKSARGFVQLLVIHGEQLDTSDVKINGGYKVPLELVPTILAETRMQLYITRGW